MADYWEFPGGPVVGLSAFTAKGPGSILQDVGKKKKKKKACCLTPKLCCVSST